MIFSSEHDEVFFPPAAASQRIAPGRGLVPIPRIPRLVRQDAVPFSPRIQMHRQEHDQLLRDRAVGEESSDDDGGREEADRDSGTTGSRAQSPAMPAGMPTPRRTTRTSRAAARAAWETFVETRRRWREDHAEDASTEEHSNANSDDDAGGSGNNASDDASEEEESNGAPLHAVPAWDPRNSRMVSGNFTREEQQQSNWRGWYLSGNSTSSENSGRPSRTRRTSSGRGNSGGQSENGRGSSQSQNGSTRGARVAEVVRDRIIAAEAARRNTGGSRVSHAGNAGNTRLPNQFENVMESILAQDCGTSDNAARYRQLEQIITNEQNPRAREDRAGSSSNASMHRQLEQIISQARADATTDRSPTSESAAPVARRTRSRAREATQEQPDHSSFSSVSFSSSNQADTVTALDSRPLRQRRDQLQRAIQREAEHVSRLHEELLLVDDYLPEVTDITDLTGDDGDVILASAPAVEFSGHNGAVASSSQSSSASSQSSDDDHRYFEIFRAV